MGMSQCIRGFVLHEGKHLHMAQVRVKGTQAQQRALMPPS